MKNKSIWKDYKIKNKYSKINQDINVDVLIIGGGLTGISVLQQLDNTKLNVCLVERNRIGRGVTSNTTGKLNYLQDNVLYNIKKDKQSEYLMSQIEAIKICQDIITKNSIDCDFHKASAYLFSTKNNDIKKIKDIKELLLKNSIKVMEDKPPLISTNYSIMVSDTYLFHPLKYIDGLLNIINNKQIYENSKVEEISYENKQWLCKINDNIVTAKYVVIASHYPYFLIPFFFPLKSTIEKSYMSASKYSIKSFSAISIDKPTLSLRTHLDYLLCLTNSHDLSSKTNSQNNFEKLKQFLNSHNLKPEYLWSNNDIMTNDYLPYIGFLKDNLLIATGYNTWGMTNSILSSKIIKDLLLKKKNKYTLLFDPKRCVASGKAIMSSMKSFTKSKFIKQDKIIYKEIDGQEVAIYKNHIVYRKCPHLKCNLLFNEIEETWDCPCHGSRFDIDGNCIEGPSNYNICYQKKD